MAKSSFEWTEERCEQLKNLWEAGRTGREIKEIMGAKSRSAVMAKISRLGLQRCVPGASNTLKKIENSRSRNIGNGQHLKANRTQPYQEPKGKALGPPTKMVDLTQKQCRYPIGDPKDDDFHFCGAEIEGSHPYCATHFKICHATTHTKIDENNPIFKR